MKASRQFRGMLKLMNNEDVMPLFSSVLTNFQPEDLEHEKTL